MLRHSRGDDTIMARKMVRRWRLFCCIQGKNREEEGRKLISKMKEKGFKAKRWATRPEHFLSGHFHIVVLCTFEELCKLGGVPLVRWGKKQMEKELGKLDQLETVT